MPDTPLTATNEQDLNAPAPKASDGKPDLSGIWPVIGRPQAVAEANGGRGGVDVADSAHADGVARY